MDRTRDRQNTIRERERKTYRDREMERETKRQRINDVHRIWDKQEDRHIQRITDRQRKWETDKRIKQDTGCPNSSLFPLLMPRVDSFDVFSITFCSSVELSTTFVSFGCSQSKRNKRFKTMQEKQMATDNAREINNDRQCKRKEVHQLTQKRQQHTSTDHVSLSLQPMILTYHVGLSL